jgi:hypothetical protein
MSWLRLPNKHMNKAAASASAAAAHTYHKCTSNHLLTEQTALFALLQIMTPITIRLGTEITFPFDCCGRRHGGSIVRCHDYLEGKSEISNLLSSFPPLYVSKSVHIKLETKFFLPSGGILIPKLHLNSNRYLLIHLKHRGRPIFLPLH